MKDDLLRRALRHYADSADFNGLYLPGGDETLKRVAAELVRDGQVEVMSEEDYPNPHIRPWPSRRSIDRQVASLEGLTPEGFGVCLYPTVQALRKHRPTRRYPGQPYRQAMAKGRGTLELAYFRFDVLEQYRNDPRFAFDFHDFGARVTIGDEAYTDDEEPEHDKTGMRHIGFAYDLSSYERSDPLSPVIRRVCAFYGDLSDLSPVHQQRWKTYEVDDEGLEAHPAWWRQQMGHWPDGHGPFERLFFELAALNELHERAFGEALLNAAERPRGFGWLLRPSQQEWESFIHDLDKLLSENIRHAALDQCGVPRADPKNGGNMGTLSRLSHLLTSKQLHEDTVKALLKPLRDVRQARQRPAHTICKNVTDKTFVHKQILLLESISESVHGLRLFWQAHPTNKDWQPKYGEPKRLYRM